MAEEWKTTVAEKEAVGILTAAAPGDFAGKEGKHVPTVSVTDGKATLAVRVIPTFRIPPFDPQNYILKKRLRLDGRRSNNVIPDHD